MQFKQEQLHISMVPKRGRFARSRAGQSRRSTWDANDASWEWNGKILWRTIRGGGRHTRQHLQSSTRPVWARPSPTADTPAHAALKICVDVRGRWSEAGTELVASRDRPRNCWIHQLKEDLGLPASQPLKSGTSLLIVEAGTARRPSAGTRDRWWWWTRRRGSNESR